VKIRFQADADLKHAIVAGVLRREARADFRRAESVPLEGLDDFTVLSISAQEGRVVVSHDVNTMERHFRDFILQSKSPGLILIPQIRVRIGDAVDDLLLIWEVLDAVDFENRVCLFPSLSLY
jgi:hypothetical protein